MPVYKNETAEIIVEEVESSDGQRHNIKINPGETKTTEYVLTNGDLTEVTAAPYYNPLMTTHTVTSTGVGDDKTIQISRETKLVSIFNSTSIQVNAFLRSTSNLPGLPIFANTQREITVGCNVDQIVFQFAAAATIYVEERK
jgi:hypothetical protein